MPFLPPGPPGTIEKHPEGDRDPPNTAWGWDFANKPSRQSKVFQQVSWGRLGELMKLAVQEYLDLGLDVIPLKENDKRPLLPGWNRLSPEEQWSLAPNGANLGIRCGGEGRICVIDCDDKNQPGTYENVVGWLERMGVAQNEYPVVQTASGVGRHIYLSLTGILPAGNYANLSAEFGTGEVRYGPGAYVVGPPSVVDGCAYGLLGGDF